MKKKGFVQVMPQNVKVSLIFGDTRAQYSSIALDTNSRWSISVTVVNCCALMGSREIPNPNIIVLRSRLNITNYYSRNCSDSGRRVGHDKSGMRLTMSPYF